jgi:hypothetical protein
MISCENMTQHQPGIRFDEATFRFSQDGNTLGTTEDWESLEIRFETQLPGEEPFIVIKSESGWSLGSLNELVELVDKCRKAIEDTTK